MNPFAPKWRPLAAGLLVLSACGGTGDGPAQTGSLTVQTAPLELVGIDQAVYTVTVTNALGQQVWQAQIDSNTYGDGRGDITYVGPCDASPGANPNTIVLTVDRLIDDNGVTLGAADWVDPGPQRQIKTCLENQDVLVVFNLTLLRSADQGFFDIAVNFDDIFCSAKLDCQPQLLHDAEGVRGLTAVVAFACTAGQGQDTSLYWGDAAVVCRDANDLVTARFPILPGKAPGQHGPIASTLDPDRVGVYRWAIYRDSEDFVDVDKCYWNMAIGLDLAELGAGCAFEATSTAAQDRFVDPAFHTPRDTVYPFIRWDVPLTNAQGALVCGTNALGSAAVAVEYTTTAGIGFMTGADCGGTPFLNQVACTGTPADEPEVAWIPQPDGKVIVTYGGQSYGPYALPAGTTFDVSTGECCFEPCCEEN